MVGPRRGTEEEIRANEKRGNKSRLEGKRRGLWGREEEKVGSKRSRRGKKGKKQCKQKGKKRVR